MVTKILTKLTLRCYFSVLLIKSNQIDLCIAFKTTKPSTYSVSAVPLHNNVNISILTRSRHPCFKISLQLS